MVKIDICKIPRRLLLQKTREMSDLFYHKFRDIRTNTVLDSEKPQIKLKRNFIEWNL